MQLAVDIGNTNISFGIFRDTGLLRRFDIPTKASLPNRLKRLLARIDISNSIICSVVPLALKPLARDLAVLTGGKPYIIGKEIKVPIKNRYLKPQEVGQDRLVNAYAGIRLYRAPLIVVDFGTAVTFDVISKDKDYLGGMIIPGLAISLEALSERAALLPRIKLAKPKEFIGRSTKDSMLSGIVYGFACLTDNLIARIRARIGKTAYAVGTGGNVVLVSKYCCLLDAVDKDLTLKGLNSLLISYKKIPKKNS